MLIHIDHPFLNLIFVGFLSLFPAVNPIGTAFVVDPLLTGLDMKERKNAAKKIVFYCFLICIVSLFAGGGILKLFGISIPVVQMAGGIMICRMGWMLLNSDDGIKGKKETAHPDRKAGDIDDILFYPLAFPMSTGAGTISVLLTLSAHVEDKDITTHMINLGALSVAVFLICALMYVCYANTPRLIRRLGPRGEQIVNRLSAFLVFCIGMQIFSSGILALIKS
jgi:multiple antibiotic resistance protein